MNKLRKIPKREPDKTIPFGEHKMDMFKEDGHVLFAVKVKNHHLIYAREDTDRDKGKSLTKIFWEEAAFSMFRGLLDIANGYEYE